MKNAILGTVLLLVMSAGALALPTPCAMPPASADEQTFAEAAKVCRASAVQGDAKSQYFLALMYHQGKGVPQDSAEAIRWCRKAADQGNAKAQSALGSAYYYGEGVQQDYAEATRWYRKAADQGEPTAQDGLGSIYYYGRGVPQDYAEAVRWYSQSAAQGYAWAQYNVGFMYDYGRGVSQDKTEAIRWYRRAADQGNESAQRALGLRGRPLSTLCKMGLSIGFLGNLILAMGFLLPGRRLRNRQQRFAPLIGLLGLSHVGLDLYRHSPSVVFHSVVAVNALTFTQYLLGGIFFAAVISVLWPTSAKIVLGISGTLFIGINLLFLVAAHHNPGRFALGFRGCYLVNGLLVGVFIPLSIFVWLRCEKTAEV